jgi:hypothetical protein
MNRNPERNLHKKNQRQQPAAGSSELEGLVEMGMKDEALRLARRTLKGDSITADTFNDALDAIIFFADGCKPWAKLVESAYARLSKRDRRSACSNLLSFHCCNHDYEAASRFIPRRFEGEEWLSELGFAMETMLALGKMNEVEKLARRLPRAIKEADNRMMQAMLLHFQAEYLVRKGDWDRAIKLLEIVQLHETFSQNAVAGIVEIHAACALLAIQRGLQLVEKFNQNFDPVAETIVPGKDKAIQQTAEKEFRRLQKILENILPEKRRKKLGV